MGEQHSPCILCVDDDESHRQAFTHILQSAGFATREATTGADALRLAEEKPDLILLDVSLPDINGFEVCRRIKEHDATAAIPVLHMSAVYIRTEDRAVGLNGGADGYLTKPVEPHEVLATIKALLRVHHAEEAARRSAQQWQATFDAIHDALCLLDMHDRVVRCNPAMQALLQSAQVSGSVISRPCRELLQDVFGAPGADLAAQLRQQPSLRSYEVLVQDRWLRVSCDPIVEHHGQVTGRILQLADVTGQKLLAEQLRQAQKMEAVGQLAGGVAHDFNNLLAVILSNLSLLRKQGRLNDLSLELLALTEKAALRAADLTRQLLGFSRRVPLYPQPVLLSSCLEESLAILGRTLDPRIHIQVKAVPDLWQVHADPNQMGQVLINLCLNSRDAMPQGGQIVIEMDNVVLSAEQAQRRLDARAGDFVRLRVRDTGSGIPPEVLPRIFEPFFTTKEPGKGTGLGLSTVFGIIKQHQGWIECRSTPGQGTVFDVYLPRYCDRSINACDRGSD